VAELPSGGRIVRFADGPGLVVTPRGIKQRAVTASWLGIGLPMAAAKPLPARLVTGALDIRIAQGVEYALNYKVEGAAASRVKNGLRSNIATQIGNLRILQGAPSKSPTSGQLLINTNFATPATQWDLLPQVTLEMDGDSTDIYGPMITFDVVPGYLVVPAATTWSATPGMSFTITGAIYREPTFEGGLVTIEAQELPDGVTCQPGEAAAEARHFRLDCHAGPATAKGAYEIRLVSSAPDTGRKAKDTYKGPEVTGSLKVE